MFGTSLLFTAFYITLALSTLFTCSVFKDRQSRRVICFIAVLTAIYVAEPAVTFMQGYIRACEMVADYIVTFCGPAGTILLMIAVPASMLFIPAPPSKK